MRKITSLSLLILGVSSVALAAPPPIAVPEIHVATGVQALAVLSGVALMIRGRRR